MENVTKRFGKVVANNAINLELHEGEILSLLGENGSGKTTLMNMLSGIYFPDEGQIYIHGEPVTIASPKDAFEHGIGMIHQHFKLVDLFTATENIILGLEGKLDIAEASKKVNINVKPEDLGYQSQKLMDIAKRAEDAQYKELILGLETTEAEKKRLLLDANISPDITDNGNTADEQ